RRFGGRHKTPRASGACWARCTRSDRRPQRQAPARRMTTDRIDRRIARKYSASNRRRPLHDESRGAASAGRTREGSAQLPWRPPSSLLGGRRRFAEADQIGEQLVRAIRAGRQLAPQPETDVNPAALAVHGLHQRAALLPFVVGKRILELQPINVSRIALAEKI